MPKKPNIENPDDQGSKPNQRKGKKRGPKGRKNPKSYDKIKEEAKKSKRKNVKVFLPAVIANSEYTAGEGEQAEQMSSAEISYQDALLAIEMEKLAARGLNNDQIIAALAMSRDTFYKKLRDEPYFAYGLKRHRGMLVHEVRNALVQNALGFEYFEQQGTALGDVVNVMKKKLPETRAQEILLYNMDSENFKRKVEPKIKAAQDISSININIKRRAE